MRLTIVPCTPSVPPLRAWPGGFGEDGEGLPDAAGEPERRTLRGKRVLLVEDEAMLAWELQYALEDAGAIVIGPALTLREALTMFHGHDGIDGAVLDVNLAGHSVFPLARDLGATGVPILFNTGHADPAELLALFPVAEVLTKPNASSVLTGRLAALIERSVRN